jgi:translation initiation factor 2 subunit 2
MESRFQKFVAVPRSVLTMVVDDPLAFDPSMKKKKKKKPFDPDLAEPADDEQGGDAADGADLGEPKDAAEGEAIDDLDLESFGKKKKKKKKTFDLDAAEEPTPAADDEHETSVVAGDQAGDEGGNVFYDKNQIAWLT